MVLVLFGRFLPRGFEFFGTPTPYPPKGSTFHAVQSPPTLLACLLLFPQTPSGGILKENPAPEALTGKNHDFSGSGPPAGQHRQN